MPADTVLLTDQHPVLIDGTFVATLRVEQLTPAKVSIVVEGQPHQAVGEGDVLDVAGRAWRVDRCALSQVKQSDLTPGKGGAIVLQLSAARS